jgi:hypothetical protein
VFEVPRPGNIDVKADSIVVWFDNAVVRFDKTPVALDRIEVIDAFRLVEVLGPPVDVLTNVEPPPPMLPSNPLYQFCIGSLRHSPAVTPLQPLE